MKKNIFLFTILICTITLSACDGSKNKPSEDDYKNIPLKSEITSVQPMTGIVLWTTNSRNSTADANSLEYSYMLYKDVVKEKGVYDWTVVDRILDAVAARKHQAILRFRYVYVGDKESAVPQYIRDLPDYEETIGVSEGRETCFPDWRHAELQRFHLEFYEKFAERYDKDKRIAFVQTGFGLWSEYHIYDGPFILGRTFPSKEFQTEFFQKMDNVFDVLPWNISIDAASSRYSPFSANRDLLKLKFGLFDDSFMHQNHGGYNTTSWNFFDRNRYKESPAGGEFSYYSTFDQQNVLNIDGMYGRKFEDEAAKFHITYMIGNDQPRYQTMDRIKEASMACGYKFKINSFRASKDSSVVEIENTGVAPIYKDAFVSVNGVRSSQSLKLLQPGEKLQLTIASGGSNPTLTIESDYIVDGQKIEFQADLDS